MVQLVVRFQHNPHVPGSKPKDFTNLLHRTWYRTYGCFVVFPMHVRCNMRRRISEVQDTQNMPSFDSGTIELAILCRELVSPILPLRTNTWYKTHREFNTSVGYVKVQLKTIRPKGQDTRHPRCFDRGWVIPVTTGRVSSNYPEGSTY